MQSVCSTATRLILSQASFPTLCTIHTCSQSSHRSTKSCRHLKVRQSNFHHAHSGSLFLFAIFRQYGYTQSNTTVVLHTVDTSCRDCGSLALARGVVKFIFICISIVLSSWLMCGITATRCEGCDMTTSIYREREGESNTITTYTERERE